MLPENLSPETPPQPSRGWRFKFYVAFRGIVWGVRGESSFVVHFLVGILVVHFAIVLRCSLVEWCVLLGCIALVLTAELFNSTIETLFRHLDENTRNRAWPCLDIAAGAVLVAALFAALIGCLIFVPKLIALL